VSIQSGFSAVHRVRLADGSLEPLNGHDWRVRVRYESTELDPQGMVVDFTEARGALDALLQKLHQSNLNDNPVLQGRNPTAEVIAEWVFVQLSRNRPAGLARVEVTEAPGCTAAFTPPKSSRHAD
jgi:6-pyruvoyltetrahydropterin/6-carboxytetrahydropterin synthase